MKNQISSCVLQDLKILSKYAEDIWAATIWEGLVCYFKLKIFNGSFGS